MNKKISILSEQKEQGLEIQTQSSISFFSVLFDEEDSIFVNRSVGKISNLSLIERLESSNLVKIIYKIFGNESFGNNKEGIVSKIFNLKHLFYKKSNNKILVKGLDGIEFEFTKNPLTDKSGISIINFEVKNLKNNLSRTQRHYLQSVFYNLKQNGFNIKYIDDNFSDLSEKDYIIGHKCSVGDVCNLITNLKDNYEEDNNRIKKLLELLKNGKGDFEKLKKEIISLELKNILNFKLALDNIIITRNNLIEQNSKKVDSLLLQEGLKNSFLIGNETEDNRIDELITKSTDSVLISSYEILKKLSYDFKDLIHNLEFLEKSYNSGIEISKSISSLHIFVKKSDSLFINAEKLAKKGKIWKILNPRNWPSIQDKAQELKQLTKQQEIDMSIDVIVEFLNDYYNGKCYKDKILFLKEKYKTNNIVQTFLFNDGVKKYEKWLEFNINDKSLYGLKYDDDSEYTGKFPSKDWLEKFRHYYKDEEIRNDVEFKDEEYIFKVKNYDELENIFGKYEYYLKQLYLQDYAFEKSLYTDNYQKVLYKKGEFYFDEKVDFEDFTKSFFEKVRENFGEKQLEKKNIWERLDFEIIEKNEKKTEDLSEINNIFDIKIGDNIFPIYIVNPIGVNFNKILTFGTDFDNNLEILDELRKISNEINRKNLQNGIKEKINNILVMNFDKTDMNAINKNEACKYKFFANKFSGYEFKDGKTDLEKGVITTVKNDNESRHNQYHNPSIHYDDTIITKKYFISDLSVNRQNIGGQGSLYFDFFLDLKSGNVLNKYIVDYLVYGKKIEFVKNGEKLFITNNIVKGGQSIGENPQYDEYDRYISHIKVLNNISE